jgi:hypothetical protein
MNMNDVWHRTKIEPKGNTMKSIMTALNPFETFLRGLANWLLLGLTGMTACGANFQNLSFEAGPIYNNPLDYSAIYPDVLPNWTVRFGNTVQPGASCNNFTLDYPVVALMSQGGFLGTNYVIAGNRSVYLQSSASLGDPLSAINVSISQVGGVPADAQSLVFDARNQWSSLFPIPPGPFKVTMDGVAVPLILLTSDGDNVTYAANIANWSGQTTELSIGVLASSAWGGANWEGWSVVDSIRFSPESVPEPTIVALVGLSWVLLGLWRTKGKVSAGGELSSGLEIEGGGIYAGTQNIIPVSEPSAVALTALGGLLLGFRRWKK